MHDAAASGHPLNVATGDDAACARAVAVFHLAVIHDGDGLEPAVRMITHATALGMRIGLELHGCGVVQQQKRGVQLRVFAVVEHVVHPKAVANPVAAGLFEH